MANADPKYVTGNPMGQGDEAYAQYIIDQGWKNYTPEEHATWGILYDRQRKLLEGRACDEYMESLDRLEIGSKEIPDFKVLSERLKKLTGWEVVPVPGLIPDLSFFKMLSERKFPAGNFIRRRDQLDYIEEPDVFHDVFGHVPLLAHPIFADHLAAYGAGGLKASKFDAVSFLARLYWYTVEFGLINTPKGLRIYGAGILSSKGESVFSLEDPSPNRIGFNPMRTMRTNYRVDDYQQTYFVIDSFEQLFEETDPDFAPYYEALKADNTEYAADQIVASDAVITRGTGQYARSKKSA